MMFYLGILLSSTIALSYATVGGQYSVNVHFVPPLVNAPCSIAQFWSPSNVTCALCFCMTGSLSRCIPQPGCNPQAPNTNTTSTMNPNATMESTTPAPSTPDSGSMQAPPDEMPPAANMTAPAEEKPAEPPAETTTEPPAETGAGGKVRGAKPGKSRRRRHSGY